MSNMSRYLRKKLGDAIVKGTAYTLPTGLWLSLHDALLTEASVAGDDEISTSGTGYGRVNVRSSMEDFDATTGISRNTALIQIGPATADWGMIYGIGLNDAETGGNLLFWVTPTVARLIINTQPFEIPIHNLSIRMR